MQAKNTTKNLLTKLRRITAQNAPIQNTFNKLLRTIASHFGADACSYYMSIDDMYYELVSAVGFEKDSQPLRSYRQGDGLIGEVALHKRSLRIADISTKFNKKNKLNNLKYKAFLGVPVIKMSHVIGILTLRKKRKYDFSKIEADVLETVSVIFNEIMNTPQMESFKKELMQERGLVSRERMKGLILSKGYGIGNAIVHRRRQAVNKIFAEDKAFEKQRLLDAHTTMNKELDEKFTQTKLGVGEHTEILDAYRMFAQDKGWLNRILENIETGLTAEAAVERSYESMWNRLSATTDNYLRERLSDLRDVADRLQSYLSGDTNVEERHNYENVIVVAQTMGPAELMDYDYHKIKGLVIEDGTPTMHVAIVAKALNIPVIAKIQGVVDDIKTGDVLAIDAQEGFIYPKPSEIVLHKIQEKIDRQTQLIAKMNELKRLPAKSKDGVKIGMYINVGLDFDLTYIEGNTCDGVGLYRTEIPFMTSNKMPDVDQQFGYYQKIMDKAGSKKVIFRSLDVGSDKLLPYWSGINEENPAIGWRSIRITLDRRAILRKQIKAILQATAGKELNIMFPMISNLSEFEDAKETVQIELEKEKKKGQKTPSKINYGLMVEVPSVIFQLDNILKKADFISVGTNDLSQFMFACDRGNPRLLGRYDVLSAPFLSAMKTIVDKAKAAGVYCSVCGEMASNPIEAMVLIGLGYRHLSMSGASLGKVKSMIRTINVEDVADYVENLMQSNKKTLRPQLLAYAQDHGIEIY